MLLRFLDTSYSLSNAPMIILLTFVDFLGFDVKVELSLTPDFKVQRFGQNDDASSVCRSRVLDLEETPVAYGRRVGMKMGRDRDKEKKKGNQVRKWNQRLLCRSDFAMTFAMIWRKYRVLDQYLPFLLVIPIFDNPTMISNIAITRRFITGWGNNHQNEASPIWKKIAGWKSAYYNFNIVLN